LNKDEINFQQFKGAKSYSSILKTIFDIDIQTYIQSEKIDDVCIREILNDMYIMRHKLIHGVESSSSIDKDKADNFFDATKKLSDFIFNK